LERHGDFIGDATETALPADAMLEDIASNLASFEKTRENLIPILQMIQERHAYLAPAAMRLVAERLGLSAGEVYGVATFYNQFRFHPPGRRRIRVCMGTACHVVGGEIILENFERKLGIKHGETTADGEYSVERVACVGCCALAPVSMVDEVTHGHMAPSKVEGLLLGFQVDRERSEREKPQSESD
jgi:NADH-quinone oxidoreductase subunit E